MNTDLQRASMWKRISAWLFDGILLGVVAVLFAMVMSMVLGYDANIRELETVQNGYAEQYGVNWELTESEYLAMTPQEQSEYQAACDAANAALQEDEHANYIYNLVIHQTLLIVSVGILLAILVMEFVIPLFLKNGQTVGKKMFSLGVMRVDSIRLTPVQLFIRTVLGKFAIETMIPVYIIVMLILGVADLTGTILLGLLLLAQLIFPLATRDHKAMHDMLAGTVVVDISSQQIFRDSQDLINYTKKVHAERAAEQKY